MEKLDKEVDIINERLRKRGRDAYDNALAKGITVTFLRGNDICEKSSDGVTHVIKTIEKSRTRVTQKSFKIK